MGILDTSLTGEVSVRQSGAGAYTTLGPRVALVASPYALSVAAGSVADNEVAALAGISYSKLKLTGSILNTDLAEAVNLANGGTNATDAAGARTNLGVPTVSGTITSGQVAYWNGIASLTGSDGIVWDAVNNRLGIGSLTPNAPLEVNGAVRMTPQASQPACDASQEGSIYYDNGMSKHRVCRGSSWVDYIGPQGIQGPVGSTGPTGPTGATGAGGVPATGATPPPRRGETLIGTVAVVRAADGEGAPGKAEEVAGATDEGGAAVSTYA